MGGKGSGRKQGSKDVLPRGTVKAIKAFRNATAADPDADEPMGVVLGVMRGTIRGRYVGDRLRSAIYVREDRKGKPVQRHEISATINLADLIVESMRDDDPKPGK